MGWRDQIAKAVMGIKAYHSSPHDFDRFDLSKIGTGEGAQVYGHGIYAAENPAVSGQGGEYWNQFMRHPALSEAQQHAGGRLAAEGFDKEKAIAATQRDVNDWLDIMKPNDYAAELRGTANSFSDKMHARKMLELRQAELEALVSGKAGPRTYELNIKEDPANFLDWDKPIAAQHPTVQSAVERFMKARSGEDLIARTGTEEFNLSKMTPEERAVNEKLLPKLGAKIMPAWQYDLMEHSPGTLVRSGVPSQTSQGLLEGGVPGIKYLDQGSRGDAARIATLQQRITREQAQGLPVEHWQKELDTLSNPLSNNYVVFDPSIIDITKKYAVPGAIGAGAMGSLAAQDQYEMTP